MYEMQMPVIQTVVDSFSGILGTIIEKPLEFSPVNAYDVQGSELAANVCASIEFTAVIEGIWALCFDKVTAATLCDMMLGGDGRDEFTDEDIDAFLELSNQLMGGAVTALTALSQKVIGVKAIEQLRYPPFPVATVFKSDITIDGVPKGAIYVVIDKDKLNGLTQLKGGGKSMDENKVKDVQFASLTPTGGSGEERPMELLMNVKLRLTVELGRTDMLVKDILELGPGSVIELNKLAGEPIDILANNTLVAKGEVVVVDENFGVRVTSLVSPEERLQSLK